MVGIGTRVILLIGSWPYNIFDLGSDDAVCLDSPVLEAVDFQQFCTKNPHHGREFLVRIALTGGRGWLGTYRHSSEREGTTSGLEGVGGDNDGEGVEASCRPRRRRPVGGHQIVLLKGRGLSRNAK